jgi:RNA-binding protein Tab2/Atab2
MFRRRILILLTGVVLLWPSASSAFQPPRRGRSTASNAILRPSWSARSRLASVAPVVVATVTASSSSSSPSSSVDGELTVVRPDQGTDEWELDCYSRPVVVNGKKLWEVLITDSAGSFRYRKELPSNQVNSKTLRQVVDDLMEQMDVKPNTIRFFRGSMFNMINIALSELPVISKPSRCTFSLASWLEDRHKTVYPRTDGYNRNMAGGSGPSFLDVRTPVRMPDSLRGEKYAFVALPVAEFMPGGGVAPDNIGVGRLCPLPDNLPGDAFVQGVVILSARAKALASWLAGTEVVALTADLRKRILTMETDIDTQYLMAKLNDEQRAEGAAFEEGKDALKGLHFISVQESDDSDPEGFWLLRELPTGI